MVLEIWATQAFLTHLAPVCAPLVSGHCRLHLAVHAHIPNLCVWLWSVGTETVSTALVNATRQLPSHKIMQ